MLETSEKTSESLHKTVKAKSCFSAAQLGKLEEFGKKAERFGVNFMLFSDEGDLILLCRGGCSRSDLEPLRKLAVSIAGNGGQTGDSEAQKSVLACALKSADRVVGTAIIDMAKSRPWLGDKERAEGAAQPGSELMKGVFDEMLRILAESFEVDAGAERQIEMMSIELAQVYEELVLLHKLSMNMKVTEPDANFLQMACDSLTDIVSVKGIAVLLEREIDGGKRLVLAAGSGLIDINEHISSVLRTRLGDEIRAGKEALLDSEVDSPFKYRWHENIKNIIAVPLFGKEKAKGHSNEPSVQEEQIIGLMVAVNRLDKPDFDSTDVKLFNSVASGCAVFVENGRLFGDLKELFIGSLKALTSSIDAKDPYTRGHSERVAFISRWVAERFAPHRPLDQQQIHRIYLAGLLHDIGKVGIDETVLRKKGKLTEAEFEHVKKHPYIGAGILSGIKQMSDIVPGVLSHHERYNGGGYPNGLRGEQIPLIARIIGLADSFDAMTSKRTYRDAMTIEQALAEIEKELGSQFDEQVARVFLDSDVYKLWDIMKDDFSESYGQSEFSEYGTLAVGALVR